MVCWPVMTKGLVDKSWYKKTRQRDVPQNLVHVLQKVSHFRVDFLHGNFVTKNTKNEWQKIHPTPKMTLWNMYLLSNMAWQGHGVPQPESFWGQGFDHLKWTILKHPRQMMNFKWLRRAGSTATGGTSGTFGGGLEVIDGSFFGGMKKLFISGK